MMGELTDEQSEVILWWYGKKGVELEFKPRSNSLLKYIHALGIALSALRSSAL